LQTIAPLRSFFLYERSDMKTLYLLLLAIFAGAPTIAQRTDLDRFTFNARYRNLPLRPMDTSYKTYTLRVESGRILESLAGRDAMQPRLQWDGWRQLPYDAHIHIDLVFEDVLVEGSEIVTKTYPVKDKDGKQVGERMAYRNQVRYSYAARWRMTDYLGNTLQEEVLATRMNKQSHSGPEYNSEAEAKAFTLFGYVGLVQQLNRQVVQNTLANLGRWLTQQYGYTDSYVSDFLWILNKRKHPEHEGFHRAWINFRQAMMLMTPDQPVDAVREKMKPSIDYFQKVKRMYAGSTDKSSRKVLFAASFNLAKIHYYLDEPDKAMAEAGEVVMNGYDAREGYRLQQWAENLQQQISTSPFKSRHFPWFVEGFQGPGMATTSK
jgi:hypothetical protein